MLLFFLPVQPSSKHHGQPGQLKPQPCRPHAARRGLPSRPAPARSSRPDGPVRRASRRRIPPTARASQGPRSAPWLVRPSPGAARSNPSPFARARRWFRRSSRARLSSTWRGAETAGSSLSAGWKWSWSTARAVSHFQVSRCTTRSTEAAPEALSSRTPWGTRGSLPPDGPGAEEGVGAPGTSSGPGPVHETTAPVGGCAGRSAVTDLGGGRAGKRSHTTAGAAVCDRRAPGGK